MDVFSCVPDEGMFDRKEEQDRRKKKGERQMISEAEKREPMLLQN